MKPGAGRVALVTGAAGFLGSHLVEALLAEGWAVRALDDLSTGSLTNLAAVRDRLDWRPGDVRDGAALAGAAAGADTVFHLAGRPSADEGADDPVACHTVHAEGALAVLEAARAAGVRRVVQASSIRVYGPRPEGRLGEGLPPAPASPYAVGKLCGEVYGALHHCLHGLETVSLRYFPTFGPRQRAGAGYADGALARARRLAAGQADPGGEEPAGGLLYVEDAARATRLAADAERAVGVVVNVAGEPGRAARCAADGSRAKTWLGFEARVSAAEGLARTAAWLREEERSA